MGKRRHPGVVVRHRAGDSTCEARSAGASRRSRPPWWPARLLRCCVNMSCTAHRYGWLPAVILVSFLVLTLGSGAAWPATGGGHGGGFSGGGHGGGFRGGSHGGHGGGNFPRGPELDGRGFGGRHEHDHDDDDRRFFVFPYYVPYYGYDPYYPYPYPYDAYCDPYSPYYAPEYC